MKKSLSLVLCLLLSASLFGQASNFFKKNKAKSSERKTLKVYSYNEELSDFLEDFKSTHPDFEYNFEYYVVPYDGYERALNEALNSNNGPDIFVTESDQTYKYTLGNSQKYCLPFEDLDIDVEQAKKDVARYVVEQGTNSKGKLVGLDYQASSGVFVYRRSMAIQVFGTDDPDEIEKIIGGGSGKWDKFLKAAEKLFYYDIRIVSSLEDLWRPVAAGAQKGWVQDGKLYIDPKREAFYDMAKTMYEKGYVNGTRQWTEEWFQDMRGSYDVSGCFGYFGPSWFINYVLAPFSDGNNSYGDWAICRSPVPFFWGTSTVHVSSSISKSKMSAAKEVIEYLTLDTSEHGGQYRIASGCLSASEQTVPLTAVMENISSPNECLGYQDTARVFARINNDARGNLGCVNNDNINYNWLYAVYESIYYGETKKECIQKFRETVSQDFDL